MQDQHVNQNYVNDYQNMFTIINNIVKVSMVTTSFKVLENNDYSIILLEDVKECLSKDQLRAHERKWIETLNCVNKRIEGRTKKEWYCDNLEKNRDKNRVKRKTQT